MQEPLPDSHTMSMWFQLLLKRFLQTRRPGERSKRQISLFHVQAGIPPRELAQRRTLSKSRSGCATGYTFLGTFKCAMHRLPVSFNRAETTYLVYEIYCNNRAMRSVQADYSLTRSRERPYGGNMALAHIGIRYM